MRLRAMLGGAPKALAEIGGVPLLGRQLEAIRRSGACQDVLVLTGHGARPVADFCSDGGAFGLRVRCVAEVRPLGTGGALFHALPYLDPVFLVLNGDMLIETDLAALIAAHRGAATLALQPCDHPEDADLLAMRGDGRITALLPYPHPPARSREHPAYAGLAVCQREVLALAAGRRDFSRDILAPLIAGGAAVYGYRAEGRLLDIGTPERLAEARAGFAAASG
jgi:NDP-sugar pyrophosphorylase family protein